jgi:translation elongation factor EF-Tu-like GTPase
MVSPNRVRIGVLGHVDHGKTTLTAAITKVLRDTYPSRHRLDGKSEWVLRGVEYQTRARRYLHVDPSPFGDRRASLLRATPLDGAVLVVSAVEGVMPQTRQDILGARWLGVPALVVALNKADQGDERLMAAIEEEVRDELTRYGYPGNNTPIVRVSAFHAMYGDPEWTDKVLELMDAVDKHVPSPARPAKGAGASEAYNQIDAEVYAATTWEGGSVRPLWTGTTWRFDFRTTEVPAGLTVTGSEMVLPGDTANVSVRLSEPVVLAPGDPFLVTQPGLATYAWGRVTQPTG